MGNSLPGFEEISTDILIIGAGGAGLRAAISAAQQGLKVAVICKSLLGKAHTVMAEGGIASALGNVDPEDSWETHFKDTMRGGQMLNNWRMAELLAKESPERVWELERWGMVFDRTQDGKILQRPFGAHTYRRLCHVGDRTGLVLIRTLQDKAVSLDVDAYMEYTVIQLLTDGGGRVVGALSYRRDSGEFVVFRAKATIVATGGWGKMYSVTSNSWEGTGDGAVLAYDVGAELMDVEMVQFHPTGMVWPPGVRGILVTEAVRGEGGILLNSEDERFHGAVRSSKDGTLLARRRRPGNLPRSTGRPGLTARRRIPRRVSSGRQPHPTATAEYVPSIQDTGRHRHHSRQVRGWPNDPLRYGWHPRRSRESSHDAGRAIRDRRSGLRGTRGESTWRQCVGGPACVW